MRRLIAGSMAAILVSGLGLAFTGTAQAVPPPDQPAATSAVAATETTQVSDELPNPAEDKRRELREQAITGVINGELQPEEINGSTVVNVGPSDAAPAANGRSATLAFCKRLRLLQTPAISSAR